jgi:hypothetical protein
VLHDGCEEEKKRISRKCFSNAASFTLSETGNTAKNYLKYIR